MALTEYSYAGIDTLNASERIGSMLSRVGMEGSNTRDQIVRTLGKVMNDNTAVSRASASVQNATVTATRDAEFQRNTHLLAQMNESYNANEYLLKSLSTEDKRLSVLDDRARRDLYRLKQVDLDYVYRAHFYRFMRRVIILTLLVFLLLFLAVTLKRLQIIPGWAMWTALAVIIIAYACLLVFNRVSMRRTSDWSSYYWKVGETVGSDVNSQSGEGESCNNS